ncbi:MAG: Crp/Fnr family transcriptional regulator [Chitinophagaceae bacterium]|nr:Crp/Fnr family transcriptional regulator [Chitinophagaceae bacterium]
MLSFFQYLNSIYPLLPEVQAALLNSVRQKELRKGQVWLQQGAVCDKLTFIEKGMAKLYFESGSKEVVLWYNKESDIILSVQSYFNQSPSEFSIRAVEPCTIFYIHYTDMNHLLQKYAELNINARVILQRYYALSEIHVGLLLQPPRTRFDAIAKIYPWMVDGSRITDKMLAAYMGVTPACISYYRNGRNGKT